MAQPASGSRLTAEELNRLSTREIKDRLERNERFTALPSTVKDVVCPPEGSPLFIVGGNNTPSEQPGDYVQDEGSYRLVRFGSVLGASSNEVVLLGAELRRSGVILAEHELGIIGTSGVRHLRARKYPGILQAFKTSAGWGFISGAGVKLGSSTNLSEVDLPSKTVAQIFGGPSERVFVTRPDGTLFGNQEGRLVLTVQNSKGELQREEFKERGNLRLVEQGLVHLRDGRWLSIGKRLIIMRTNLPPAPPERVLTAVLDAAKAGDREAFSRAAQAATEYQPEQLQGLVRMLEQIPDPLQSSRDLERNARDALRWTTPAPPPGVSVEQKTQMEAVIARHRNNLASFLTELDQLRKGALGVSPKLVGALIQSGYQHFSGWWIGAPRLLKQESLNSVLLDLVYLSPTNTTRRGVFQLDQDARLELLGDYGPGVTPDMAWAAAVDSSSLVADAGDPIALRAAVEKESRPFGGPCQYVSSSNDAVLLFFPFEGLARIGAGKFEWVDRSEPFRRMQRVLGADAQGRVFLASTPALMSHWGGAGSFRIASAGWARWAAPPGAGDLWVYRASSPMPASPIARLFPVVTLPVVDAEKRVWFLPLKPSASMVLPEGMGALADTPAGIAAMKALQPVLRPKAPPTNTWFSPMFVPQDEAGWNTDLCYYQGGQLTVAATNVAYQTILATGNAGPLLAYPWSTRTAGALLVDQGRVLRGANLHELAQKFPRELLEAVPTEVRPSSLFAPNYDRTPDDLLASIARTGDYVWINQGGTLEVYCEGKPLGIASRLSLMNSPARLNMQGPLKTPMGPTMVLTGQRGSFAGAKNLAVFWATPSTNGIDLVRGPDKDLDPAMDLPLINPVRGCVYFPRFITPPRFWILSPPDKAVEQTDGRVPLWVTGKGDLLTGNAIATFGGWRIESQEKKSDIAISYVRSLRVTDETPDGKLICRTAEGLAWLERNPAGSYVITRELDLHAGGFALSLVGETDRETFVTVVDARQNAYLAVLNKP